MTTHTGIHFSQDILAQDWPAQSWRAHYRTTRNWSLRHVALGFAAGLLLPLLLIALILLSVSALAAPITDTPNKPTVLAYQQVAAHPATRSPARPDHRPMRRPAVVGGEIAGSFDAAATALGVPDSILAQTYRVLTHAVDLQRDIQPGDTFRLGYETRSGDAADGAPAELLFVWLHMRDHTLAVYRHTTADGFTGYFDRDGRSAEGPLLKTPVEGSRVSSNFGMRRHPILGYERMHKGLDFAAPRGTPILAAGHGVVVQRQRNGGYGRYIRIDHGAGHATAYAHLSKYADGLDVGDTVRQGDVIGYVGSTGLATGPHLHYEVLRDDTQINPVAVALPPQRVLADAERADFRIARIKLLVVLKRAIADTPTETASAIN